MMNYVDEFEDLPRCFFSVFFHDYNTIGRHNQSGQYDLDIQKAWIIQGLHKGILIQCPSWQSSPLSTI
jgi:hypothetical protein